ncbi:MAG TPA: DUF4907 domain-containing protein [Chitinophagaceae bacterium]|jgi:hypothetical protein|nr:DUF4907 domain-containing protein [Chitinophagaceae bacterium]
MNKTITITKHDVIVITIAVAIAAAIPFCFLKDERKRIDYRTFHTAMGWGYDILVKKKIFIHQENVPAIAEKKGFDTEESAKKTANLIIDKLKNNKPPTLTHEELVQICQSLNEVKKIMNE